MLGGAGAAVTLPGPGQASKPPRRVDRFVARRAAPTGARLAARRRRGRYVERVVEVPIERVVERVVDVPVERVVYVEPVQQFITEPVYETRKRVVQVAEHLSPVAF